jgi:hypothetical protein
MPLHSIAQKGFRMRLRRLVVLVTALSFSIPASADDKDIIARAFNTTKEYLIINIPPRPDAWPGAIFTANLRVPIRHGDGTDPALHRGQSIGIDSNSGFNLNASAQGGFSALFSDSAEAGSTADIVMSFPDARIVDMDATNLRQRAESAKEVAEAAKAGQIPLIVIKSYLGTPTMTLTKKATASASAWAKVKSDAQVGAQAAADSGDKLTYKAGDEFIFAFETTQITVDPSELKKGRIVIQLASLPGEFYIARQEVEDKRITQALATYTGISVDAIKTGGIFGGDRGSVASIIRDPVACISFLKRC